MVAQTIDIEDILDRQAADFDNALDRLFELLRVPSISTDPDYAQYCQAAADLLNAELATIGFSSRVVQTKGHPILLAHHEGTDPNAPHVLFYGHYDVQPPDPLEEWKTEPFDPVIIEREDGSKYIRARGSSDDKSQIRTFIECCRYWHEVAGGPPCKVTLFFEGEEESGSPSMPAFLDEYSDELKADIALVCDTTMWNRDRPAITVSLRGNTAGEVTIKAADRDLHSGLYGGAARNPIQVLAEVLGGLKDENGHVTLPGFYDGVEEVHPDLKEIWDRIDFSGEDFLGEIGLSVPAGEKDKTILEQIWSRPTAEINGIKGGYTGAGFKTVIPAEAMAKVSFRLVPHQDPQKVWQSFEDYVQSRLPGDCEAVFNRRGGAGGHAVSIRNDYLNSAVKALDEEWGQSTVLMGSGGSIPIVGNIKHFIDMDTILVGFGLDDDRIHSPNEKYEMQSFRKGTRSWIRILKEISSLPKPA